VLEDHFDVESMEMLKEVMEDEFSDLLTVYIDDSMTRLPDIRQALQDKNAQTLRELAHSLKGASANITATALAALCYEMETAAKDEKLDGLESLLSRIEQEFETVRSHLQAMIV